MNEIASLNIEEWLVKLLFAMLRTGGAFLAAPVFSAVSVPVIVRVSLAAGIGVMIMGAHDFSPPADPLSLAGLVVIVQELFVGLTLGFILQIAFAAPLVAGEQIATASGLGFAGMVDPQSGTHSPVIGQFLNLFMVLIFLSLNGHLVLLEVITRSYEVLPMGDAWLGRDRLLEVAKLGSFIFASGLLIALPVGFTLFAANLVVATLTRSAPQLNVFSIGLPLTVVTGFVAMAITFPAMGDLMIGVVESAIGQMSGILLAQ